MLRPPPALPPLHTTPSHYVATSASPLAERPKTGRNDRNSGRFALELGVVPPRNWHSAPKIGLCPAAPPGESASDSPTLLAKRPELTAKRPEIEAKRPDFTAKRPEIEAKHELICAADANDTRNGITCFCTMMYAYVMQPCTLSLYPLPQKHFRIGESSII